MVPRRVREEGIKGSRDRGIKIGHLKSTVRAPHAASPCDPARRRTPPLHHAFSSPCLPAIPRGLKPAARPAFTLIELLVVIGLIGVLVGAVLVAAPALIDRNRSNSTELLLTGVRDMVEQFAREQQTKPTVARSPDYQKRFGFYPPDELEPFTDAGVPGAQNPKVLTVSGAKVIPGLSKGQKYNAMTFREDFPAADTAQRAIEHRDNAAMVLAIQMHGKESRDLLASFSDQHLRPAASDESNTPPVPLLYLDRPDDEGKAPNGQWDPERDEPLRVIVDAWGVPLQYFAQRDYDPKAQTAKPSSNHPDWNQASTEMIRRNGNRPVIVSYGPNGKDQLTEELLSGAEETTSMVGDWMDANDGKHAINNPLNADNLYPDPRLRDRLAGTTAR